MRLHCTILTAVVLSVFSITVLADTINVPSDQPSIQAGIDAAYANDTVLVAPGTYHEHINFHSRAITLASHYLTSADASVINTTIIDGSAETGAVVTFDGYESSRSVLNGFTITGGSTDSSSGAGVRIVNSNPIIRNCLITGNSVTDTLAGLGGGVHVLQMTADTSHPELIHCKIEGNTARHGAGVSFRGNMHSVLKLTGCSIVDNNGPAVWCTPADYSGGGTLLMNGCVVSGNDGVGVHGGNDIIKVTVDDCKFRNNTGGGIHCYNDGRLEVTNSLFESNGHPDSSIGAILKPVGSSTTAVISYCVFDGNAALTGAALNLGKADIPAKPPIVAAAKIMPAEHSSITNCTFVRNRVGTEGGATVSYDANLGVNLKFENNIIAFNTHFEPIYQRPGEGVVDVKCTDIFGNIGGDWVHSVAGQLGMDSNVSVDPMFCDTAAADFGIDASSPCVAGNVCEGQIGAKEPQCSMADVAPGDIDDLTAH